MNGRAARSRGGQVIQATRRPRPSIWGRGVAAGSLFRTEIETKEETNATRNSISSNEGSS